MLIWEQVSVDAVFIQRLITAQCPWMAPAPAEQRNLAAAAVSETAASSTSYAPSPPSGQRSAGGRGKATIEGDLKDMHVPNVLQSMAMSQATGRLEVANETETAVIFLREGRPIDCNLPSCAGTAALLEVVGWDDGQFHFYPENKQRQQTISKRLDTILMEGAALDDKLKLLRKLGGIDTCYPTVIQPPINGKDLDTALAQEDVDTDVAKLVYDKIDGRTRLLDTMAAAGLAKCDWVPVVLGLSNVDLIRFEAELIDPATSAIQEAKIDWSEARNLERYLQRGDTGLYSYPAFLLALEREHARWTRFARPYAVVILELSAGSDDPKRMAEPLFAASMKEVAAKINDAKRELDMLAHYETFKFALLLPESNHVAALRFVERLTEHLDRMPLGGPSNGLHLNLKTGVASVPDDCLSLGALLALARPSRTGIS
jgi:GGDEF domain-containing protein